MYQAFYRKWRPRTFDAVVGQTHITSILKNQIITGRLSHAYLFIGTRGTGKTSCAKILARAANCEALEDGNPCNRCPSCVGIESGAILDVVELDAASNNGVDHVRALREEAIFSPATVRKRVYIIDEVHMLSNAAFNALLKILEEPPAHLMFILATTELHKVPATILSRCQRHSFRRIDYPVIEAQLLHIAAAEDLQLSQEAAQILAQLSDGSMRDALSLLDQCSGRKEIGAGEVLSALGMTGTEQMSTLLTHMISGDVSRALQIFSELWQEGKDPSSFLDELSMLLRDILMQKIAPNGGKALLCGSYTPVLLQDFSQRLSKEWLVFAIDKIADTTVQMSRAQNPRTAAELCLLSLSAPELSDTVSSLAARIATIEAKLQNAQTITLEHASTAQVQTTPTAHIPWKPEPVSSPPSTAETMTVPQTKPAETKVARAEEDDLPPWEDTVLQSKSTTVADDYTTLAAPAPKPPSQPLAECAPAPASSHISSAAVPLHPEVDPPSGMDSVAKLFQALEKSLDVGSLNILKNHRQAQVLWQEDTVRILAEEGLPYIILNHPQTMDKIKKAIQALSRRPVAVTLTATKPGQLDQMPTAQTVKHNKLDSLSQFSDIVVFED